MRSGEKVLRMSRNLATRLGARHCVNAPVTDLARIRAYMTCPAPSITVEAHDGSLWLWPIDPILVDELRP